MFASSDLAEVAVTLAADLHARPAGALAQAAARFESAISLVFGDRAINPTGILSVMSLGATAGSVVTIRAEGPDAGQAVRALAEVLDNAE